MMSNHGQVLVEAIGCLLLLTGSIWINLELVRRAQLDLLLHHASFLAVRARTLGMGVRQVRADTEDFLIGAWGRAGESLVRNLDYSEDRAGQGRLVRLHVSFPSLWRFKNRTATKYTFESTRKCLFPMSFAY